MRNFIQIPQRKRMTSRGKEKMILFRGCLHFKLVRKNFFCSHHGRTVTKKMAALSSLSEEYLREASCIGDYDSVIELIKAGINVNSRNSMNGWTALHWAAARNNKRIVEVLLRNGANPAIKNEKGEIPAHVSSDNEIKTMLGEVIPSKRTRVYQPPFTPSYLRYPTLPVIKYSKMSCHSDEGSHSNKSELQEKLILKVRIANLDPDFIEIELDKTELTMKELVKVCCEELEIESGKIKKIRKLPDTIIRKDKEVERLTNYQEIEVFYENNADKLS